MGIRKLDIVRQGHLYNVAFLKVANLQEHKGS